MWHCKQAIDYQAKHGKITGQNYHDYISDLRHECKNRLEKYGIDENNVYKISKYAKDMYLAQRYDEVDAEICKFRFIGTCLPLKTVHLC